jgi:6-phosphogluconolactonase (cycloisomerase 2 family)
VLNTGPNGEQLFANLKQVIVTDSSNEIVVTDYSKGLISVNPQGKINWFLQDLVLSEASGICVASGGVLFVSGQRSHNIIQVDKNGNKKGVLLGTSDELNNPYSLAFDSQRSRLIVGMNSNNIHVYTLSTKA